MTALEVEWRVWLSNAFIDSDGDGLDDAREQYYRSDPRVRDTDSDGLSDGLEVQLGTDPANPDTDGDGVQDGAEVNIAVDGFIRDWELLKLPSSAVDPKGDNIGGIVGTDMQLLYAALDDRYLYLTFKLYDLITRKDRVQFCFGIDIDGDGTWEYQPGFDLSRNSWLWNLTQGMDYSDLTKVSAQYGTIVAANEIVEFRMPLFAIGYPKSMWIEPYLVIERNGQYMAADAANRFHIDMVNNRLPPSTNPLVPDSKATTIRSTRLTSSVTTASAALSTTAATTLEGTKVPETGTLTTTPMLLVARMPRIQTVAIGGIVLVILAALGAFFLQRRRKQNRLADA
jgi:hypothetical protein